MVWQSTHHNIHKGDSGALNLIIKYCNQQCFIVIIINSFPCHHWSLGWVGGPVTPVIYQLVSPARSKNTGKALFFILYNGQWIVAISIILLLPYPYCFEKGSFVIMNIDSPNISLLLKSIWCLREMFNRHK